MAKLRKIPVARVHHRQPGQDGNAVVALLAPGDDIAVAQCSKGGERHLVDRTLAFLQTQDVRLFLGQKPRHQTFAQADGIDVPGCKGKGHRHLLLHKTLGNRPQRLNPGLARPGLPLEKKTPGRSPAGRSACIDRPCFVRIDPDYRPAQIKKAGQKPGQVQQGGCRTIAPVQRGDLPDGTLRPLCLRYA